MTTLIPRLLAVLLTLLILTPTVRGEGRVVREFGSGALGMEYNDLKFAARPLSVVWWADRVDFTIADPPDNGPRTVTALTLDNPGITQTRYFILGDVTYEHVDGKAYLEMWSDFPDGGHYFSRTLGDRGPMMAISGTSATRPFMLPFTSDAGHVPSKLTLNIVMPGKGKVTLSRVRLVENGDPATTQAVATPAPPAVTPPATSVARSTAPPLSPVGLPPEVAAAVRKQLAGELVAYLNTRSNVQQTIDSYRQKLGAGSADVKRLETELQTLNERIEALKAAMAQPFPDVVAEPPAPPTGVLAWLDRHLTYLFAGLVGVLLLAMWPLRRLMKTGRGRAVVLGFFGLMFVGGVGQLFAAGVVLGMGRPADAWVTLLGGAAVLIVCGGLMLRQAKAHYADFELRKLRAMDVG